MNNYFEGDNLLTPALRRRGLPIGNLTSQFFANLYLNEFDHYVKEVLRVKKYVRYVDDFAFFGDDKERLTEIRVAIEARLDQLRLKIHPIKSQLFETRKGANFLGFRVLPDRIRVINDNLRKGKKRIRRMEVNYTYSRINLEQINQSLQSWFAHLDHGDTWRLRQSLSIQLSFLAQPEE